MPKPALLSIVCPAYNEADGLGEFVRRVADLADAHPELTVISIVKRNTLGG